MIYILVAAIAILIGIIVSIFYLKRLIKFALKQYSLDLPQMLEGSLLVGSYYDEQMEPQEIFDTSLLDERGLMVMTYVNPQEKVETKFYPIAVAV